MNRTTMLLSLFAAALLASETAQAGDDDERPAYLIYIDPETGRYTTTDPMSATRPEEISAFAPPVAEESNIAESSPNRLAIGLLVAAAMLLAIVGHRMVLRHRRPQNGLPVKLKEIA